MAMEWWVNDTAGKTIVLGAIHVRMPLRLTQFPHGLPSDLNPGHCGEEPGTKTLSHGKCLKSWCFYYYYCCCCYYYLADAIFNNTHVPCSKIILQSVFPKLQYLEYTL
jgi:hypothetical protein